MKTRSLIIIIFLFIFSPVAFAELKLTKEQDSRATELFKETRCLVCQSQTIYDSNSEMATDLKLYIIEQIIAGKSNYEIENQLVKNYGDWILMTPAFSQSNYFLWFGPFIILLLGAIMMLRYILKNNE
jgi:cytochrome c-type biogenesis protein CcmH